MKEVDRQELLNTLEMISPGLSPKETTTQSNCFVFQKNKAFTFNDSVACSFKSPIKDECAIEAGLLLALLHKLKDKTIEIGIVKNELIIKGKRRKAGIRIEKEIQLPIETIDKPKGWKKLPEKFTEALSIVQNCASVDDSTFELTCIHLHQNFIEACNSQQLARYKIKLLLKHSMLVRRDSLKHIIPLEMTEFSESKSWIHFKNKAGLIISCRRYLEEYRDMAEILNFKGTAITLPKNIKNAVERAEIFSAESADRRLILELQKGKLRIKGQGETGWYWEVKKIKYNGPTILFTISPDLLVNLLSRDNHCEITTGKMKITGKNYTYVTVLGMMDKK